MEYLNSITLDERLEIHKKEYQSTHRPKYSFKNQKHIGRGKGTFVERDLIESPAFIALRGAAPQMLIYLLAKREFQKAKNTRICVNSKDLKLSYVELKKLGITQPRATRGFDDLLEKGFINIEHSGGGCQKDQSIYSLSDQYFLWRKGMKFSARPKAMSKGFTNSKSYFQHTNP